MFVMFILVIAGFGAGWIAKDCVVMFILSFLERFPHQPEVSEAEEVEEEDEELTEGQVEELGGRNYWSEERQDFI